MSTMIYLTDPITTRTRRRCYMIEINNPNIGEKILNYHQQDLTEDLEETEISSKQAKSLSFPVSSIATDLVVITDPVTGLTTPISGFAIALWLEQHYIIKTKEDLAPPIAIVPEPPAEPEVVILEPSEITGEVTPEPNPDPEIIEE